VWPLGPAGKEGSLAGKEVGTCLVMGGQVAKEMCVASGSCRERGLSGWESGGNMSCDGWPSGQEDVCGLWVLQGGLSGWESGGNMFTLQRERAWLWERALLTV
jgi:hypothetical protein